MAKQGDVTDLYNFRAQSSPHDSEESSKKSSKNPFLNFNFREGHAPPKIGKSEVKYDPAGQEVMKGERQWRVKANTEYSKKHSKIVGVSLHALKLYDEHGSELLREYPMHEISGFSTDVGIGVFYFTWRPTPSHPGEHLYLYSKKYCLDIQQAVNDSVVRLLKMKNIDHAEELVANSGMAQVRETTPTQVVQKAVRRISNAKRDHQYPAGAYVVPGSPVRRDSNAPLSSHTHSTQSQPQKARSRKGSSAAPNSNEVQARKKSSNADFVDLEEF